MRKIIHLSDLHMGYRDCEQRLHNIVQNIVFTKEPGQRYVVVVTGDAVDTAKESGVFGRVKRALEPLKTAGFKVLLAPGNHDYGTGAKGSKKYMRKYKKAIYGDKKQSFPKLDMIEDVAFIALDSMAATFNWLDVFGADGELGERQLQDLVALLNRSEVKQAARRVVYLHHHPFDPNGAFHELQDAEKLRPILEGKIDCLLFGHNHDGGDFRGKWSIPRCYDGSSSTGKRGEPAPIRVMDLERDAAFDYDGKFLRL